MGFGIAFSSLSIFYSILLTIVYFNKKRVKSIETKIYGALMLTNLMGLILAIFCYFGVRYMDIVPTFNFVVSRLYIVYLLTWISIFTIYVFSVSCISKNRENYYHKILNIFVFLLVLETISVFFLPLYYVNSKGLVYSYGPVSNLAYVVSVVYIILCFVIMLKNIKKIAIKKYIPLLTFMIGGSVVIVIQKLNPGLLLFTSTETFVTFLMYFTIENPDMKMIEEIHAAKEYTDNLNAEKSLFIFNMSQEIKLPVNEVSEIHKDILFEDDVNVIKEKVRLAEESTKKISDVINDVLDVSTIDSHNMKIVNNKYNIKLILKELVNIAKNNIGEKGIDFRINIDKNIPEYLYGDSIRVKQVINTVLDNAVKYTNKGFVEMSISSIMKNDVCRLIINIEDSGIGMNSETINKLFASDGKSEEELIHSTGLIKFNLANARKLLSLIGGTIIVKSEVNKGTKVTIVIDQKKVEDNEKELGLDVMEKYSNMYVSNKKILVVDDNESSLKIFSKMLTKENIKYEEVRSGKECLDKIRQKEKYDLILLDEKMEKLNGYETMKKLKQIRGFNIPVILTTLNPNVEINDEYLEYGFSGYLLKPFTKEDLFNVINKYLK